MIAFFSISDSRVVKRDGSGKRQLTFIEPGAVFPLWDPKRKRLAFRMLNNTGGTWIMDLDKDWDQREPVSLPPVNEAGDWFNAWSWSPDGKLIAGTVAGWHDEEIRDEPGIYIYSLETGRYRKITDNGNRPEWLPDSRHLIFIKVVSGAAGQVSLADSQTKRPARVIVSPSPHIISSAGVASDGRRIFYTMNNHQVDIYLLSLDK